MQAIAALVTLDYHVCVLQEPHMRKGPTLKDIAREIGVHPSTVSRALDPETRATLTADVIEEVRLAADRLGYRPNRIAASLRTNRSMTVGVMIPDITNMIFPPILRGAEEVLEARGYAALVVSTDNIPEREARLVEVLRERGVDGIIHAAAQRLNPLISSIAQEGTPVVTVNRRVVGVNIPAIVNDEKGGMSLIADHLQSFGHQNITHIAGPNSSSTGQERLLALQLALSERKMSLVAVAEADRYTELEGVRCTRSLIRSDKQFTAIVCANDRLALGAIEALREAGLRCPENVSVTGYNDMPLLDRIQPALTTIRIQSYATGQAAAHALYALIRGEGETVPLETIMPVEIVIRKSVAQAA
jgi:LacI family transcriptional regulator